jgi:hypothetical protein
MAALIRRSPQSEETGILAIACCEMLVPLLPSEGLGGENVPQRWGRSPLKGKIRTWISTSREVPNSERQQSEAMNDVAPPPSSAT